jgi:hypothetical protein
MPATSRFFRHLPALCLPLLGLIAAAAGAQTTFVDVTPTADPHFSNPEDEDFWINAVAPADVDGDGDLDLAAIGFYVVYNESVEDRLLLLLNEGLDGDGRWSFKTVAVPMGTLTAGASDLAWGDYDGDGDDDLLVGSDQESRLFRNDAGTLNAQPNALPPYVEDSAYDGSYDLRSLTWADYDNDGDLDFLVPTIWNDDTFEFENALVRNDGADGQGGWTFTTVPTAIDPAAHAQSTWADDDGDGDLDLLLLNVDNFNEMTFLRRYQNQDGAFQGQTLSLFADLQGLVDWADADDDGDLDLLVVGNLQEPDETYTTVLRIYRNDGGTYTPITLEQAPSSDWLDLHAATWADYDSDGDVDILATGSYVGDSEIVGRSKIYANEGNTWSPLPLELAAPISSVGRGGTFTWLDLDGDGDLDYLVAGAFYRPDGNGLVESRMLLFRNDAAAANAAPAAPTGVTTHLGANAEVTLTWNAAVDDLTPATALTYDLEIRPHGAPASAARRLPEPGKISQAATWTLEGLAPGSYRYRLCAVDTAFNPGAAAEGSFTVGPALLFADSFEGGSTGAWSASH